MIGIFALVLVLLGIVNAATRPCEIMVHLPFDQNTEDEMGAYVEINPPYTISVVNENGCVGGGAAMTMGSVLSLALFTGNELSNTFVIRLSFKSHDENRTSFVPLLSNGCANDDASVMLEYQANSRTYRLLLRDSLKTVTVTCIHDIPTPVGFQKVSIEYEVGNLVLTIDDMQCVTEGGFIGAPVVTNCPLSIGGTSSNTTENFFGFLDEVSVQRWCLDPM